MGVEGKSGVLRMSNAVSTGACADLVSSVGWLLASKIQRTPAILDHMSPIQNHYRYSRYSHGSRRGRPPWKRTLRAVFSMGFFANALLSILILAVAGFIGFGLLFVFIGRNLPDPNALQDRSVAQSTKIYDRTGEHLLYEIHGDQNRTLVPLSDIPPQVVKAFLSAEDDDFYAHSGIDVRGIVRAMLANTLSGSKSQGASTLTQQLVKNAILSPEKTYTRKLKEIILSLKIEQRYSKDEILQLYFNEIPFGSTNYGIESAAQSYFGKPASKLTLAEGATLAAMVKAPTRYLNNPDQLAFRRDRILDAMVEDGFIDRETATRVLDEPLNIKPPATEIKAPHFTIYVKQYLEENYSPYFLKEKGLKVYTSLDWDLQTLAEKFVKEGVVRNKNYNANNAALTAINPRSGEVLALVGSADYFEEPFPEGCSPGLDCQFEPSVNIALYGQGRQPGSAFKPFAYALAFKKGLSPETWAWDVKTEFNPDCPSLADQEKDQYGLDCYHPKNYDEKFRGQITLRNALAQSVNVPSVKVLYLAGLDETIALVKDMGITTLNNPSSWYGLSLVLGGGEVKLLDMVSAYGVFAADGLKTPPVFVLRIEDSQGNVIEENKKTQKRILEPQVARLINDVLSDNEARSPLFGPYSSLYFPGYKVAAKTGTTQNYKDAWTIGYTNSIAAGVWAGNNDGTVIKEKPGVALAAPIWHKFMEKALEKYPPQEFTKPEITPAEKPTEPHSLLYYFKEKPNLDPQFQNWEEAIRLWLSQDLIGT